MNTAKLEEWESIAQENSDKYSLGKSVYTRLELVDDLDDDLDDFFNTLSEKEWIALIYYNNYLQDRR